MAWEDTARPLLRAMIDDFDAVDYTNARLTTIMVANAYRLVKEISFDTAYTVDVANETIAPDPESDANFINFLVLKSAIMVYMGIRRQAQKNAIEIWDGPAKIDGTKRSQHAKDNYEEMKSLYNDAKLQYTLGNSRGSLAILSPYTSSYVHRGSNL